MGIGDRNLESICGCYTPIKQIRCVVSYMLCLFEFQLIFAEASYFASWPPSLLIHLQKQRYRSPVPRQSTYISSQVNHTQSHHIAPLPSKTPAYTPAPVFAPSRGILNYSPPKSSDNLQNKTHLILSNSPPKSPPNHSTTPHSPLPPQSSTEYAHPHTSSEKPPR